MNPSAKSVFELTEYDPSVHGAFVRSTWAHGALRDGTRAARQALDAKLRQDGAKCVVAHVRDAPAELVGWAAREAANRLLFAYVIVVMRRRGLARVMLGALGFDATRPVPLTVWTPSSQAIAASGRPVYFHQYERRPQ